MTCLRCGNELPAGSRKTKVYCSKSCTNAAYKAAGRGTSPERQREYALASYHRRRAQILLDIGVRTCPECQTPLPEGARLRRVYCSRRCINQVSLRERRAQRQASTERRRMTLRNAEFVGVSERDWCRLVNRHGGLCAYCGIAGPLTKDHVVPISRGGRHAIGNILPARQSCNSSKRDDFLAHWRAGRAYARKAA